MSAVPYYAYRIYHSVRLVLWEIIPPIERRELLTWRKIPNALVFLAPFLFMAYLVRRRDTHLIRALLLPTTITSTVWCTCHYRSDDPRDTWREWVRGLLALVVIGKSIDYAFTPTGRRRLGEKYLRAIYNPQTAPLGKGQPSPTEARTAVPQSLRDALEVSLAMRGIGWDFGKYVHVDLVRPSSPSLPSSRRSAFVSQTVRRIVRNQLYVDVWQTIEQHTPGVTADGGTIFLPHLPPLQRYAVSTALHLGHGLLICAGVSLVYDYLALVGILLLKQSPRSWPPIQGDLRDIRSLHQFWSRGWHQALRYTFLTFGGFPGQWLAGSIGMVFGTFLASGLFHELGLTVAGRDIDHRVTVFFLLQAVGITLEKAFRWTTGRRVGGVLGTLWAMVFVLGLGQMCTDAWFARGIGGAPSMPLSLSVVRPLLLPLLRRFR